MDYLTPRLLAAEGARCLLTGDMGIAHTTPSAALIAAFTGAEARCATGRGTGADDGTWERKVGAVERALVGTGAVLGLPPVQAAARAPRDLATFDGAGVADKATDGAHVAGG